MIRSIRLENFKAIKDVEVELDRLTVFVGPNGSGKSSILQGIEIVLSSNQDGKKFFTENGGSWIFDSSLCYAGDLSFEIRLSYLTNEGYIRRRVSPEKYRQIQMSLPTLDSPELLKSGETWSQLSKPFSDWVTIYARMFRLNPAEMARPSFGLGNRLWDDGGGLASMLAKTALNRPDAFEEIQEGMKRLIPTIRRVRFDRRFAGGIDDKSFRMEDVILFDLTTNATIAARAASEGTLLILGLLTILYDEDRPDIILLDDLDRGLHPLAQKNVVDLLHRFLDQNPDLQIAATTHSPYLVDALRPEEVRMTSLNDDGSVACGRLVDHPKFERWKDEMLPGELWSLFGEKWVTGASQPAEA